MHLPFLLFCKLTILNIKLSTHIQSKCLNCVCRSLKVTYPNPGDFELLYMQIQQCVHMCPKEQIQLLKCQCKFVSSVVYSFLVSSKTITHQYIKSLLCNILVCQLCHYLTSQLVERKQVI